MKVIRNTKDHDEFWCVLYGWVSRIGASEFNEEEVQKNPLPEGGEWVPLTTGKTYSIVRYFKDANKKRKTVETGLSYEDAREHCSDPDSAGADWFDGFVEE